MRDVQVLAPMYKGRAGVDRLNARLQAVLNPPARHKPERSLPRCTFRVGDKVMVTRNDYDRDVSNGEIGYITAIDEDDQTLHLDCDGRTIVYDWTETDDLIHAYAISIHKAQGSEYPAVVIPLLTEHAIMLYRQLLYTAVTRARRLCVLVGSRRAIELAIAANRGPNRYSALAGPPAQRSERDPQNRAASPCHRADTASCPALLASSAKHNKRRQLARRIRPLQLGAGR